MIKDYIQDEMDKCGADGVDFVPIPVGDSHTIFASYTRDEWATVTAYPKSGRRYWKINDDGTKQYVS